MIHQCMLEKEGEKGALGAESQGFEYHRSDININKAYFDMMDPFHALARIAKPSQRGDDFFK